jgi:replicative DNA helicase
VASSSSLDVSANAPARRVPPQDLDAEKAVLSAILLDNDALHALYEEVRPEDFYHPAHEKLFRAMVSLNDSSQPVDLHTLSDYLNTQKQLDDIGGSIKRGVIAAASEIVEAAFDQTDPSDRLLDHAESKIFELGQERSRTTFRALQDEMHDTMDHVEHLMNRGEELTGLATGFQDLDKLTGGLQRGELIIIAARPSMGKTALALNIARNAASEPYHKKVAVFSLEMTTRALVLRLLSAEAQVDASAFRTGFISVNDYGRLSGAASRLSEANIWVDDSGAISVLEMKAKSRRMAAERGLDLLIVDYMQLMHGDQNKDSREQEIAEISRGLKALAKELDIPVIALSQLNRGPETRSAEDKRPRLSDLRESGAIEQDADVIGFIYRDVVYHPDSDAGDAELIIAKQRNGPTDTVRLHFEGRFARFASVSRRSDAPPIPFGDADAFATPGEEGSPF